MIQKGLVTAKEGITLKKLRRYWPQQGRKASLVDDKES
jgi:hypothetical protein